MGRNKKEVVKVSRCSLRLTDELYLKVRGVSEGKGINLFGRFEQGKASGATAGS